MIAGQILAEKYRLVEQLSRGGMGSVWRAEHIELGTPTAIKLIDPALAETEEALFRFRREAQSAASLRSANVVQIFDYGVTGGVPYIAMELLRGQSLARRLSAVGRLTPLETAVILTQVGKALAWTHSMGVVHRDLKPDNVFLAEDAGETVVKILDFGIAKTFDVEPDASTLTGTMIGTPFYMSPEQAVGKRSVDYRSDIWAFAVIAFECLTGQRPFQGETIGKLVLAICSEPLPAPSSRAQVPAGFDAWFARAAHRDPDARFTSIREAANELRELCTRGLDDSDLAVLEGEISSRPGAPIDPTAADTMAQVSNLADATSTMSGSANTHSPRKLARYGGVLVGLGVVVFVSAAALIALNRPVVPIAPSAPADAPPPSAPSVEARLTPTVPPNPERIVLPVDPTPAGSSGPEPSPKPSAAPARPRTGARHESKPKKADAKPVASATIEDPPPPAAAPKPATPDLDHVVGF